MHGYRGQIVVGQRTLGCQGGIFSHPDTSALRYNLPSRLDRIDLLGAINSAALAHPAGGFLSQSRAIFELGDGPRSRFRRRAGPDRAPVR
jgi:hypothetical protein